MSDPILAQIHLHSGVQVNQLEVSLTLYFKYCDEKGWQASQRIYA